MKAFKAIIKALGIGILSVVLLIVGSALGIYYSHTANISLTVNVCEGCVKHEDVRYNDIPPELVVGLLEKNKINIWVARLLLDNSRSEYRGLRFQMALLTNEIWVRLNMTQEQKVEYYLNNAYFGLGCEGVSCISQKCFAKDIKTLNSSDISLILKLLKAPGRYNKECPVQPIISS